MLISFILCIVFLAIFLKIQSSKSDAVPTPSNKPLMFGRMSCPFTVKMINLLKKENLFNVFKYVDTESEPGSMLFNKYEGEGVPYFVSANGRAAGFMPTSKLFEKLNI